MKLSTVRFEGTQYVGLHAGAALRLLSPAIASDVGSLLNNFGSHQGAIEGLFNTSARIVDASAVSFVPPVVRPASIYCIGLNYEDHAKEAGLAVPDHPTVFARFSASLCGHNEPIVRPQCSDSLDFEGELAVVIGRGGRHIARDAALAHVFGYSIFNDGSVREYQAKGQQWTLGKNFDQTGGFGPAVVTADEVPPGAAGLAIRTTLNGKVVQDSNTDQMVFDVATLVEKLSEVMTLRTGDILVTGTPSGIGWTRTPKLIMRAGDVCEVSIEGLGTLRNPIEDEPVRSGRQS